MKTLLKMILACCSLLLLLSGCSSGSAPLLQLEGSSILEGNKLICLSPEGKYISPKRYLPEELTAQTGADIGGLLIVQPEGGTISLTLKDAADSEEYASASFSKSSRDEITAWVADQWQSVDYHRENKKSIRSGGSLQGTSGFLLKAEDENGAWRWSSSSLLPPEIRASSPSTAAGYVELSRKQLTTYYDDRFSNPEPKEYQSLRAAVYMGDRLYAAQTIFDDRTPDVDDLDELVNEWVLNTACTLESDLEINARYQAYTPGKGAISTRFIGYDEDLDLYTSRFIPFKQLAESPDETGCVLSYKISLNEKGNEELTYTIKDFHTKEILYSGKTGVITYNYRRYDPLTQILSFGFAPDCQDFPVKSAPLDNLLIRRILDARLAANDASGTRLAAYILNSDTYKADYSFAGFISLANGKDEETEFFAKDKLTEIGGYVIVESEYPRSTVYKYTKSTGGTVDITYRFQSLTLTLVAASDGHTIAKRNFAVTYCTPISSLGGQMADLTSIDVEAGDYFDVAGWIRTSWNAYLRTL